MHAIINPTPLLWSVKNAATLKYLIIKEEMLEKLKAEKAEVTASAETPVSSSLNAAEASSVVDETPNVKPNVPSLWLKLHV